MAIATGFNIKGAKDLAQAIQDSYEKYGTKIAIEYTKFANVLKAQWIGYDEQDFEAKLADRLCKLYGNAYDMTKATVDDIEILINNWIEFQNKNRLSAGDSSRGSGVSVQTMAKVNLEFKAKKVDKIVEFKAKTFSEKDDMGLKSSSSYKTIKEAAENFKTTMKGHSKELFDSISPSSAFFGGQTQKIKTFIEKVGNSLEDITLAIKDLYDSLDDLTKKAYKSQDDSQEKIASDGSKAIDKAAGQISNRWK